MNVLLNPKNFAYQYVRKDLTLTDDYLFSQIMKDEEFCKLFLEMLMGIKITKVIYLEAQKEVNLFPQTKGIRMDVYLEGDDEIYNIEMQTGHKHNLVKRMRYYHSAIDVDSLLRGNPYDQLKKSYVIFICNFDFRCFVDYANIALLSFCTIAILTYCFTYKFYYQYINHRPA